MTSEIEPGRVLTPREIELLREAAAEERARTSGRVSSSAEGAYSMWGWKDGRPTFDGADLCPCSKPAWSHTAAAHDQSGRGLSQRCDPNEDIRTLPDYSCPDTEPHEWHYWSDGMVGCECPGVKGRAPSPKYRHADYSLCSGDESCDYPPPHYYTEVTGRGPSWQYGVMYRDGFLGGGPHD